ncbi:MAG: phosphoserine transaminase, partial [Devosia sp.]
GEAAHGILILGPRAIERLETYKPAWPLPKIFRLTKSGKLMRDIFEGATINTVSMLCVEDAIDAMEWGKSIGGLRAMQARADANFKVLSDWVAKSNWAAFLAEEPETRSNTSVCLVIKDKAVTALDAEKQAAFAKAIVSRLDKAGVAYDIGGYRDAPTGLRIWAGSTVETSDLEKLVPWLDYAFAVEKAALSTAAAA